MQEVVEVVNMLNLVGRFNPVTLILRLRAAISTIDHSIFFIFIFILVFIIVPTPWFV